MKKSIWAVTAGFLVILVSSIIVDTILKIAGILPWDHLHVSTGLILFVILYRSVFSVAGCYLAAQLAPQNPMKHAYQPVREKLIRLDDDQLEEAPPEPFDAVSESKGELWAFITHHQAYHIGQIGILRRAFGKSPMSFQ